ncbi:hypothetical protein ACS0TY_008965 [Phlomoides rotata]
MQKSKSLCERSMELVMNIIKLSSCSLPAQNLSEQNPRFVPTRVDPFSGSSNSRFIKSKKSQAHEASKSKMQIYFMEEDAGVTSHSSVYKNRIDDDETFSDYITRFHRRNRNEAYYA